ncbi:MAG: thioredoxin [Chitinivorax sp.]
MSVIEVTGASFDQLIESDKTVVLDFWASWCGPCQSFAPVFEAAAEQHPDVVFGKIDIDTNQDLASYFSVRSVPTLMVLREKVMLFSQPGALTTGQLEQLLNEVKALDMAQVHSDIAAKEAAEKE